MKRNLFCISIILAMIICIFDSPNNIAQAASYNAKAKKEYAKILSSKKTEGKIIDVGLDIGTEKFALLDVNKDGKLELIFTPDNEYRIQIVFYIHGKLKCMGLGFSDKHRFYPNKHIVYSQIMRMGDDTYTYYKYTGNKLMSVASKHGCDYINAVTGKRKKSGPNGNSYAPYAYTVKGKRVSKKKYKVYVGTLLSGANEVKLKWHKNTAANRKKYLK